MSLPAAYLGVIVIWSTTPLAVKWSAEGFGFVFSVTARMAIGLVVCLLLLKILRLPLPWHRQARRAYFAAALGIFGAMLITYWGARFIPSGLISVLFGTTPLITGMLAAPLLGERSLTSARLAGIVLGMLGLGYIFVDGSDLGEGAGWGIGALILAAFLHALSAVLVKRNAAALHPMSLNTGALTVAVGLYLLTWLAAGAELPPPGESRALAAVTYLGLFGTVLGFNLYFYVLKHHSAGAVSLITLVTPVLALVLGMEFNGEHPGMEVWVGTGAIMGGLALYQFGDALLARR